jgi:hypothetical protein
MATIGVPSFADRSVRLSLPSISLLAHVIEQRRQVRHPLFGQRCPCAGSRCNSSASMRDCPNSPRVPLKRQDLIALNMLDLSMPVPDAASARVNDVVFIYSVPLLNQ